ncbi:uncharacterized protein LOC144902278 [Branchiostoma floridae x Branchiostoma belcheri]
MLAVWGNRHASHPSRETAVFQSIHPVCQVCKATRVEERTRVKRKLERKGSREEEDGPLTFR